MLYLNIRGFLSHQIELEAFLRIQGLPILVGITETLLDKNTKSIALSQYVLVSRLDRRTGIGKGGGIALFVLETHVARVVHVGDSVSNEQSGHILHIDLGPVLLGLWYRPPSYGEVESITHFDKETESWSSSVIGTIIFGDMNVHHKAWLEHSNGCTPEGRELFRVCAKHGLQQLVQQPTRDKYLLDLLLSDMKQLIKVKVLSEVSDQNMVYVDICTRI